MENPVYINFLNNEQQLSLHKKIQGLEDAKNFTIGAIGGLKILHESTTTSEQQLTEIKTLLERYKKELNDLHILHPKH